MPQSGSKIISIILEQAQEIEERCDGYREEIVNIVSEILAYERQHIIQATNIQKKINDKFNATSRFLMEQRGQEFMSEDES